MKLKYRIDFEIDESVIESITDYLKETNQKITKKRINEEVVKGLNFAGNAFIYDTIRYLDYY